MKIDTQIAPGAADTAAQGPQAAPKASNTSKIFILYDFDPEGDFFATRMRDYVAEASGQEVINIGERCIQPNSLINKWRRAMHNVRLGIKNSRRFGPDDDIICWNQNIGIALALYWRLTRLGQRQKIYITCTTNTPARLRPGIRQIINFAFGSKNFRYFVANNRMDVWYTPSIWPAIKAGGKVTYIPFASDIDFDGKHVEIPGLETQDYFVSTGRSNRKHDFFVAFFEKHPDYSYKIICDTYAATTKAPNIEVFNDVYGAANYAYLRGARAMLLDLADKNASAGNTAFVQALEMGVPIVMTRCGVLEDYALDGQNCLLIDDGDMDQLRAALERLRDEAFRSAMIAFQKADHAARFSMRGVARQFVEATRA